MTSKRQRIIDEQIRTWRLEQQALKRRTRRARYWPVITISREFGARGHALAEVLADRIGFTLWDHNLVQAIAEGSGSDAAIVELLDERHRKAMDEMVFAAVIGAEHSTTRYFRALVRVLRAIEQKGGSVIVGRGAAYICKASNSLNVRVVCPFDERIRKYAERESISIEQAERIVTERDRERAAFVRHHMRRDVNDASDYDVVVNASSYDHEEMTEIVLTAYEARFDTRPPEAARVRAAAATPISA